jgi:peroxiredoxin
MKLLENSKLEAISSTLSIDTPVCDITTRSVNTIIFFENHSILYLVWKVIHVKWLVIQKNCINN